MGAKIVIEHIPEGYLEIWKSSAMQAVVNQAGERIAASANAGYPNEPFRYYPRMGSFTALGFVSSTGPSGAYYQQRDKALSQAVHP